MFAPHHEHRRVILGFQRSDGLLQPRDAMLEPQGGDDHDIGPHAVSWREKFRKLGLAAWNCAWLALGAEIFSIPVGVLIFRGEENHIAACIHPDGADVQAFAHAGFDQDVQDIGCLRITRQQHIRLAVLRKGLVLMFQKGAPQVLFSVRYRIAVHGL